MVVWINPHGDIFFSISCCPRHPTGSDSLHRKTQQQYRTLPVCTAAAGAREHFLLWFSIFCSFVVEFWCERAHIQTKLHDLCFGVFRSALQKLVDELMTCSSLDHQNRSNTLFFAPLAARLLLLPWYGSRSLSSLWLLPLVFLFDLFSDWTTFEVQLRVPPAFSPLWILTRASATGAIIIHSFNRLPVLVFEFRSYKQPSTNLTAENTNKHTLSDRDKVC